MSFCCVAFISWALFSFLSTILFTIQIVSSQAFNRMSMILSIHQMKYSFNLINLIIVTLNTIQSHLMWTFRYALFNDIQECRAISVFCFVSIVVFFSDVNQTRQYCSNRMGTFVVCLCHLLYLFVSPLSNCTECSVIVNMSIVKLLKLCFVCIFRAFSACHRNNIFSHKWHSFLKQW